MSAHAGLAPDPVELFPPTAAGLLRQVETTRETSGRRPLRRLVRAHLEALREDGLIGAEDMRQLHASGHV